MNKEYIAVILGFATQAIILAYFIGYQFHMIDLLKTVALTPPSRQVINNKVSNLQKRVTNLEQAYKYKQ